MDERRSIPWHEARVATDEDEALRPIAEARSSFVAAVRRGDAKAAADVYCPDARLLAPSAELMQGRETIEAFWETGVAAGVSDVTMEPLEVERSDGLAYEIGRYRLQVVAADGDAIVVDRGKYVLVHELQADGSWKWAVEMFNPDVPPAVTPPGLGEEGEQRVVDR